MYQMRDSKSKVGKINVIREVRIFPFPRLHGRFLPQLRAQPECLDFLTNARMTVAVFFPEGLFPQVFS